VHGPPPPHLTHVIRDAPPPAITVAMVAGLAVPGALVEIEAVAAVPA
jgi:enamine deaminase RidA (YjgF/YER057c/UK114 family)